MKLRQGFISNSSSSSFVIKKKNLSEGQLLAIRKHNLYGKIVTKHFKTMARELCDKGFDVEDIEFRLSELISNVDYCRNSYFDYDDEWSIKETDDEIVIGCTTDNFNMGKFLEFINVPNKAIEHHPDIDLTWSIND